MAQTLTEKKLENAFDVVSLAVQQVVENKVNEIAFSDLIPELKKASMDYIKSEYGMVKHDVELTKNGKPYKVLPNTVLHEAFDDVMMCVKEDEPIMLVGPAGCGKNVLCEQIAKALEMDFYYTNAVTQEFQLKGFTDAMGVYHETAFFKAFKNGGIFLLDEVDASIPEVMIILNMAIAQREFDFPAPIGNVKAHPDFRVIAAGNTYGTGATYQYAGRNQLDAASLDRFAVRQMDYDRKVEMMCAGDNEAVVDFMEDFRNSANKAGVLTVVSYRAIGRFAKLLQYVDDKRTVADLVKLCLTKGMDRDDIAMVYNGLQNKTTTFGQAVKELAGQ